MYTEAIKPPDIQKWEKCKKYVTIVIGNYTGNDT